MALGEALPLPLTLVEGVGEREVAAEALACGCEGVACCVGLCVAAALPVAETVALPGWSTPAPPLGVTVPEAVGPPSQGEGVGEGPVGAGEADTESEAVEVTLGEGDTLALPVGAAVAEDRGVADTEAVEEGVSVAVPLLEGVAARLGEPESV